MYIHQFYDTGLAHASYAIVRAGKMVVIDPARDPQPYYDMATQHSADITGIIETHPHADFVSSHLEMHQQTGATIYVSKLVCAVYPHQTFDDGDEIKLNDILLRAINTPGHSPDSICILIEDEGGKPAAIFTGDTLFVGDVGRPDLRENAGNITAKKEELAKALYQSTRKKLMQLPADVIVYPAHGPGSLCGKNMSADLQSTIGREIRENYALQPMDESAFVSLLTTDQPFMPGYFAFDVELNKQGAPALALSLSKVPKLNNNAHLQDGIMVIDTRPEDDFKKGHIKKSVNIQQNGKFETWLGALLAADEEFYLVAADEQMLADVINKAAKIGYEKNIKGGLLLPDHASYRSPVLNKGDFDMHPENYTIVDVRNWNEINDAAIFDGALSIPLPELRERLNIIPTDKPIVVHCAAGYRSAAASSIVAAFLPGKMVYDLSDAVTAYVPVHD